MSGAQKFAALPFLFLTSSHPCLPQSDAHSSCLAPLIWKPKAPSRWNKPFLWQCQGGDLIYFGDFSIQFHTQRLSLKKNPHFTFLFFIGTLLFYCIAHDSFLSVQRWKHSSSRCHFPKTREGGFPAGWPNARCRNRSISSVPCLGTALQRHQAGLWEASFHCHAGHYFVHRSSILFFFFPSYLVVKKKKRKSKFVEHLK